MNSQNFLHFTKSFPMKWLLTLFMPVMLAGTLSSQANSYNYTACEISETFTSIVGQPGTTFLGRGDDSNLFAQLPFAFEHYGVQMFPGWRMRISTNGWIVFYEGNGIWSSRGLGNGSLPRSNFQWGSCMYVWHDDLDAGFSGSSPDPQSGIYLRTVGTAPNRSFIVEWHKFGNFPDAPGLHVTFQARMEEGTNQFSYSYGDVEFGGFQSGDDNAARATVGTDGWRFP